MESIPEPLQVAYASSSRHRAEVLRSARCGCFHCLRTFPPSEVSEWTDGDQTAIAKPRDRQSRTARAFVLTTKLNCIARKPQSAACFSECSHICRATPLPVAAAAVI